MIYFFLCRIFFPFPSFHFLPTFQPAQLLLHPRLSSLATESSSSSSQLFSSSSSPPSSFLISSSSPHHPSNQSEDDDDNAKDASVPTEQPAGAFIHDPASPYPGQDRLHQERLFAVGGCGWLAGFT